jgi:NAD(P)-dependent dehydrogenase (short-subunit alcohol dehydrogenase family)
VINIASEAGRQPLRIGPDYSAAKAALLSATKSLAEELAPEGIRVNAICPGPVMTDSWVSEAHARGGVRWQAFLKRASAHAASRVPLGRMGTPDDVAALAAFVASPRASWITGASFAVDGGAVRVI